MWYDYFCEVSNSNMKNRSAIIACRYCGKTNQVRKHGVASSTKIQRYYCGVCKKTFQAKYIYHAKGSIQPAIGI